MTAPALQIRGCGTSWSIMADGVALSTRYHGHHLAIAALRGVQQRLAPPVQRQCLCCATPFPSTGTGNRLCPTCRKDA